MTTRGTKIDATERRRIILANTDRGIRIKITAGQINCSDSFVRKTLHLAGYRCVCLNPTEQTQIQRQRRDLT